MDKIALVLVGSVAIAAAGCGGESGMMAGPTGLGGGPATAPTFMGLSPSGGTMGVSPGTPLQLHWGTAMGAGMEQFVDLHMGDPAGLVVPMSCAWSTDRTTLVCTPSSPLEGGTQYSIHVGGGMVDAGGHVIDMDQHGPGFGGQWIQGGMMGPGHGGTAWGMMGAGWRHSNGAYGMAFTFTTA